MTRPDRFTALVAVWVVALTGSAAASWVEGRVATIQALDKITARISTLRVPLDEAVDFGTLSVTVRRCAFHPPEEPLEVVDNGHDRDRAPRAVFTGWMFASSPAVSAMEHPVYDLTLLSCKSDP
jgi:hypothetical protein